MYHDIEIDVKNIPGFLIEDKICDSLPFVELNNTNTDDEILLIVLHHLNNSSDREAEGGPLSIPNNIPIILSENCHNTQDSDPTKTKWEVDTDSINPLSANCRWIVWVCLIILWVA